MEEDIVGYIGGFFLIITLLPQLVKTYKTKSVEDISPFFVILALITSVFYLVYGIILQTTPMIVANIILLIQNLLLLYFKKIYKVNESAEIIETRKSTIL